MCKGLMAYDFLESVCDMFSMTLTYQAGTIMEIHRKELYIGVKRSKAPTKTPFIPQETQQAT